MNLILSLSKVNVKHSKKYKDVMYPHKICPVEEAKLLSWLWPQQHDS